LKNEARFRNLAVLELTFRKVSLGKWSENWSCYRRQGGSSSSRFLIREHSKKETPPGGGVSFDQGAVIRKPGSAKPGRAKVQGGEDSYYPLNCRSFSTKEPLNIGHFCGKWPIKIRDPMSLRHPVSDFSSFGLELLLWREPFDVPRCSAGSLLTTWWCLIVRLQARVFMCALESVQDAFYCRPGRCCTHQHVCSWACVSGLVRKWARA